MWTKVASREHLRGVVSETGTTREQERESVNSYKKVKIIINQYGDDMVKDERKKQ